MRKPKKRLFKRKSHVNICMIIQTFHQSNSLEPCTAKLDKFLLSAAKSENNCIPESWYNYLRLTMLGRKTFEIDENTQIATWRPRDTSFAFGAFAIVSNIHIRRIPPETRRDWFRENKPMKHFVRIKSKFELKKGGRCEFWGLLLCDDRRFPCTVAVALTPSWLLRISPVSLQSNW